MIWPFWTDAMRRALEVTPAMLPWLIVFLGVGAQIAGVRLLVLRANRSAPPATVAAGGSEWTENDGDSLTLVLPIVGARVPDDPGLLPGAPRAYRGGQHEGIDLRTRPGTPVHAVADGFVLSIEDEPSLPERRRNQLLAYCRRRHETPGEILSVLHGRKIVLCHRVAGSELVTTSYSHLQGVDESLKPGSEVRRDQIIAWAGSTGTSHTYTAGGWAELHFELHIDGKPVAVGLPPAEAAAVYRRYFHEASHD